MHNIITFLKSIQHDKELESLISFNYSVFVISIIAAVTGYTFNLLSSEMTFKNVMQLILCFVTWLICFDWMYNEREVLINDK